MSRKDNFAGGVKKATFAALSIAGLFSLWAVIVRVIEGPLDDPVGIIVLMYGVAALVVGPLVGLLLPFARHPIGAAAVGAVVANVLYGVAFTVLSGGFGWMNGGSLWTAVGMFTVAGAVVGIMIRAFERRMEDSW